MRLTSNNYICFATAVLVVSVQCLFFLKNCYDRNFHELQSQVVVLSRENALIHDSRGVRQEQINAADKALLSRLRAILNTNNRVELADKAVRTSVASKFSARSSAIKTIKKVTYSKKSLESSINMKPIAIGKPSTTERMQASRSNSHKHNQPAVAASEYFEWPNAGKPRLAMQS